MAALVKSGEESPGCINRVADNFGRGKPQGKCNRKYVADFQSKAGKVKMKP